MTNPQDLSQTIKQLAFDFGADLCGVASIARFAAAPVDRHPASILPGARSLVSVAIRYPHHVVRRYEQMSEAEREESHRFGVAVCAHLDHVTWRLCRHLESLGYPSVAYANTGHRNYRRGKYETVFEPDLSNMYAAVAAGLAATGWHGLAITKEFGPNCRYASVITTATLAPDPLQDPRDFCDMCGECIRSCPSNALSAEVSGVCELSIEGRRYTFADKNRWRCFVVEQMDFDECAPLPDVVDARYVEDVLDRHGTSIRAGGRRHGNCRVVCTPACARGHEPDCATRRAPLESPSAGSATTSREVESQVLEMMSEVCRKKGVDKLTVERTSENGSRISVYLRIPGGRSSVGQALAVTGSLNPAIDHIYNTLRDAGVLSNETSVHLASPRVMGAGRRRSAGVSLDVGVALSECSVTISPEPALATPRLVTSVDPPTALDIESVVERVAASFGDGLRMAPVAAREVVEELRSLEDGADRADREAAAAAAEALSGADSVLLLSLPIPIGSARSVATGPFEKTSAYSHANSRTGIELSLLCAKLAHALSELEINVAGVQVAHEPRDDCGGDLAVRVTVQLAGMGRILANGSILDRDFGSRARYAMLALQNLRVTNGIEATARHQTVCPECRLCEPVCREGRLKSFTGSDSFPVCEGSCRRAQPSAVGHELATATSEAACIVVCPYACETP